MGLLPANEGSGARRLYLYVAIGDTQPKKGIYSIDSNKNKVFTGGISGQIINIVKKAKQFGNNPAYWAYQITFEDNDPDSPYQHYILDIHRNSRFTDKLINRLSGIQHNEPIELRVYEKPDGWPGISIKQNGEKVKWKYPYEGDPIPPVEEIATGEKDEVSGKPIMRKDRSKRSAFIEEMVKELYTFFTGQAWSAANVIGLNDANTSTNPSTTTNNDSYKTILADVKKHFTKSEALLAKWPAVCSRIDKEVKDYMDKQDLVAEIAVYLNTTLCKGKSYTYELDLKSKTYKKVEQTEPDSFSDDLPF